MDQSRLGEADPARADVLKQIARGKRNKEIGAELTIAEDTVKMHVKRAF